MSDSFDDRRKALEEEYFRRKEQESLEKLRQQMQAETANREADAASFKCPKDGGVLAQVAFEGVQIDRCATCGGVWLDAGELEQLTKHEESGWFKRLRHNFSGE